MSDIQSGRDTSDVLERFRKETGLSDAASRRAAQVKIELSQRKRESLNLYRPLQWQAGFHECRAPQRILQAPNQFGKSLALYVEVARAILGLDPFNKYPKRDGVAFVVGLDEDFIGRNVYRYLFEPGQFKVIRDLETNEWRAYRPWDPADKARKDEVAPAPPLIPKRYYTDADIAWKDKKSKVFNRLQIPSTGWVLWVMTSQMEPAPGFAADLGVFDEDIMRKEWFGEAIMRLEIRSGKFCWGALPLEKNDELTTCINRAEEQAGSDDPTTVLFKPTEENPYFNAEHRKHTIITMKDSGDDVYRMRILGERQIDTWAMYPGFDPKRSHNAIRKDEPRTEVQRILTENNGTPPKNWCRYMIVDPGHSICAVAFVAVPPPDVGDQWVLYDELYIQNSTAELYATSVLPKYQGWNFQAFIIDSHGGRLTSAGDGLSWQDHYEAAMRKYRIESNSTGSSFIPGCDNIHSRVEILRQDMAIRPECGTPRLLVVHERCEKFVEEMKRFRKKRDPKTNMPTDDGVRGPRTHLIECMEYAAAHGMKFVAPRAATGKSWQRLRYERLMESQRRSQLESGQGSTGIVLGAQGV